MDDNFSLEIFRSREMQSFHNERPAITPEAPFLMKGTEGYGVAFEFENYQILAELAKTIKGRMIISVNDIPEMREVFAGLPFECVDIHYTLRGAGRGNARQRELIFGNF